MISVRNLEHWYGSQRVLDIDELELTAGSITGLVGPNGSGKSSLLRVLAFLETPRRGEFILDTRSIRSRRERLAARRRVTLVEQSPLLFQASVHANLVYALRACDLKHDGADRRIAHALDLVGAGHLTERPARQLSVGEVQRVAVARALVLEPAVLLLDEPLSAADRSAVNHLAEVLAEVKSRGTAICLSSHQLETAYRWSASIIALADGRTASVTPENLFRTEIPPGVGPRAVRAGPLELIVVTDKSGPATIAIPPEDLVVSAAPLESSLRNHFPGQVVRISEDGRGGVTLTVDVGKTELVARITRQALTELGLSLGSRVILSIKAMAVRVF